MQSKVRFFYVGDIMGDVGLKLIESELPKLKIAKKIDLVIAQSENVSGGRGCNREDFKRLKTAGVDFCSGGNWTLWQKDITSLLNDPHAPIIRPANYPKGTPGLGYKYLASKFGLVLVISLLGKVVGRDGAIELDNPLKTVDAILASESDKPKIATVVNFHGDYSSEKVVIGHYLNGRVSAVIGDHWHVPTADARILSQGTAHISDVGMVGALNSSLGVKAELIIKRWRNGASNTNQLEEDKPWQLNGLIFEVDPKNGRAVMVEPVNLVFN